MNLADRAFCRSLLLAILVFAGANTGASAQDSTLRQFKSQPALFELVKWTDEKGDTLVVPFVWQNKQARSLETALPRWDALPDTLFIVMEGVAWGAELLLDERYLSASQDPFRPWVVAVPRFLWQQSGRIRLNLGPGSPIPGYPRAFTGVHRPVWVMTRDQLNQWQRPVMELGTGTGLAACLAPWYRSHGLEFDLREAALMLYTAHKSGASELYFVFPPDRRMEALAAALGFRKIESLPVFAPRIWINAYPFEPVGVTGNLPFYLDSLGRHTREYGNQYSGKQVLLPLQSQEITLPLVFAILFPLFALILLKIVAPNFLASFHGLLFRPKLAIDNLGEVALGGFGLPFFLLALRWLILGVAIGLYAFLISEKNLWSWMMPLGREGLLFKWMYPGGPVEVMAIKGLIVSGAMLILRYFLLYLYALGVGTRKFRQTAANLDTISSFPLNLALSVPVTVLLFAEGDQRMYLAVVAASVAGAFILRQVYVTFLGLSRLFGFSTALKIVYICALIALPYLIWL